MSPLGGWTGVGGADREADCSGRVVPGAAEALRDHLVTIDPIGASWGGADRTNPTSLLRSPTFTLYGWSRTVAATITVPTLVLHGRSAYAFGRPTLR